MPAVAALRPLSTLPVQAEVDVPVFDDGLVATGTRRLAFQAVDIDAAAAEVFAAIDGLPALAAARAAIAGSFAAALTDWLFTPGSDAELSGARAAFGKALGARLADAYSPVTFPPSELAPLRVLPWPPVIVARAAPAPLPETPAMADLGKWIYSWEVDVGELEPQDVLLTGASTDLDVPSPGSVEATPFERALLVLWAALPELRAGMATNPEAAGTALAELAAAVAHETVPRREAPAVAELHGVVVTSLRSTHERTLDVLVQPRLGSWAAVTRNAALGPEVAAAFVYRAATSFPPISPGAIDRAQPIDLPAALGFASAPLREHLTALRDALFPAAPRTRIAVALLTGEPAVAVPVLIGYGGAEPAGLAEALVDWRRSHAADPPPADGVWTFDVSVYAGEETAPRLRVRDLRLPWRSVSDLGAGA